MNIINLLRRSPKRQSGPSPDTTARAYSALAVSNTLTLLGMRRSAMGHNKMVQIIQGNALASGRALIVEMPQVWRFGPVLATLYHHQVHQRSAVITDTIQNGPFGGHDVVDAGDAWAMDLIKRVMDGHAAVSDLDLSSMLHAKDSPWRKVAEANDFRVRSGARIPEALIRDHYAMRLPA